MTEIRAQAGHADSQYASGEPSTSWRGTLPSAHRDLRDRTRAPQRFRGSLPQFLGSLPARGPQAPSQQTPGVWLGRPKGSTAAPWIYLGLFVGQSGRVRPWGIADRSWPTHRVSKLLSQFGRCGTPARDPQVVSRSSEARGRVVILANLRQAGVEVDWACWVPPGSAGRRHSLIAVYNFG